MFETHSKSLGLPKLDPFCKQNTDDFSRLRNAVKWVKCNFLSDFQTLCPSFHIRGPNDSHDTLVGNFVLPSLLFYFSFSRASVLLSLFPTRPTDRRGWCLCGLRFSVIDYTKHPSYPSMHLYIVFMSYSV